MRTKYYICPVILLLAIGLFYSCMDATYFESDNKKQEALISFTIENAQQYFENQMQEEGSTRVGVKRKIMPQLSLGEFTPIWKNAKTSQNKLVASVDVPLYAQYRYRAIRSDIKQGSVTAYQVDVFQKLIVVKDLQGKIAQYVLTLIPDRNYYLRNKGNVAEKFLNSGDKGDFSGIAIYTHVEYGFPVAVGKYINGKKVDYISLWSKSLRADSYKQRVKEILGQIQIGRRNNVFTRNGEDDWNYDDLYYGGTGGNDESNDWYSDWYIYVDSDGGTHMVVDIDGDGKPDAFYIPESTTDPDPPIDDIPKPEKPEEVEPEPEPEPEPWYDPYGDLSVVVPIPSKILPSVTIAYYRGQYPGYGGRTFDCMAVCKNIMHSILGANANIGLPGLNNELRLWEADNPKELPHHTTNQPKDVFDALNTHLDDGRPMIGGVNYRDGAPSANGDNCTDHWIVIYGRGYDEEKGQYYYTYVETGSTVENTDKAFSDDNRLYYDESSGFVDEHAKGGTEIYTLTQVRPNNE